MWRGASRDAGQEPGLLLAGELDDFCEMGGMVGFEVDGHRVRIKANAAALEAARLAVSAEFLQHADLVEGGVPDMRLSVWHDLPFRLKLIIYGGLVTAVALAITGVVLMRLETRHFREHLLQSTTTLADITSQTCGSSLAFHDDIFATRVLKGLAEEPSVERACLLDMQGEVFASFERPGLGASYDLSALAEGHRFAEGFLELTRPISYDGMIVGSVYLQVNLTALDERMQLFIRRHAGAADRGHGRESGAGRRVANGVCCDR